MEHIVDAFGGFEAQLEIRQIAMDMLGVGMRDQSIERNRGRPATRLDQDAHHLAPDHPSAAGDDGAPALELGPDVFWKVHAGLISLIALGVTFARHRLIKHYRPSDIAALPQRNRPPLFLVILQYIRDQTRNSRDEDAFVLGAARSPFPFESLGLRWRRPREAGQFATASSESRTDWDRAWAHAH